MKLILRTSIRTCKRCHCASRSEALFECHPGDHPKIDRLVPYKNAFLPPGLRPGDIERRTEVGPIAICSNCIDGFAVKDSKSKIVHMDGTDFDEGVIRPNRFVLSPAPRVKEVKTAPQSSKKRKEKAHFTLEQFMASI